MLHYVLEQGNGVIATSIVVVVEPCCDPAVVKVDEHWKLSLSSQHKGLFTTTICK